MAHDSVAPQVEEGTQADLNLRIAHGCEASEKGVIAESVVFPTLNPVLSRSDGGSIISLIDVVSSDSLAGLVDSIQSRDIFQTAGEKKDGLGNTVGFFGKAGYLSPETQGRVPFQFTAPTFNSGSCATKLLVQIAVADICDAKRPTIRNTKVNLWIPDNGSQYASLGTAQGVDGIGEPPVLQINRNLANNPLPPSCGASSYTVTVTPSALDVDTNLGIPGYWSK